MNTKYINCRTGSAGSLLRVCLFVQKSGNSSAWVAQTLDIPKRGLPSGPALDWAPGSL